jgi:hypothetical protein
MITQGEKWTDLDVTLDIVDEAIGCLLITLRDIDAIDEHVKKVIEFQEFINKAAGDWEPLAGLIDERVETFYEKPPLPGVVRREL